MASRLRIYVDDLASINGHTRHAELAETDTVLLSQLESLDTSRVPRFRRRGHARGHRHRRCSTRINCRRRAPNRRHQDGRHPRRQPRRCLPVFRSLGSAGSTLDRAQRTRRRHGGARIPLGRHRVPHSRYRRSGHIAQTRRLQLERGRGRRTDPPRHPRPVPHPRRG